MGWFTEVRGESLAVHGRDESNNSATIAGIKPPDSIFVVKHNGQKLAVGLGSARTTKATTPFPRGCLRGRDDTVGKKRPSPNCACPSWHEGQAGRWHGLCLDAGKPAIRGIPPSLRDERDARCKRIPRPNGRRIRHTPHGADVSRTNPVSPRRTPFGRREVASGDVGPARCPALESSRFSARRMSSVSVEVSVAVDLSHHELLKHKLR